MWFCSKKKRDKMAWATLVYGKPPKNIENESEERLSSFTTIMLMQHHRIIVDSVKIVLATKNSETRKSRTDLSLYHYQEMVKFRPFCNKEQLDILCQAESLITKL